MTDIQALEFDRFLEILRNSFSSSYARRELDAIVPLHDTEAITQLQREFADAIEIAREVLTVVTDDEPFQELLPRLTDPYASFNPIDFVTVRNFLACCRALKKAVGEKDPQSLRPYVAQMRPSQTLVDEITNTVDDEGEIRDGASAELRRIRSGLATARKQVQEKLHGVMNSNQSDKYVQEKVVVMRGGRYTIPCKTHFRQYIEGIVHDRSNTGQTFYVEPSSVVSLNNEIQELLLAESEEIQRILRRLLGLVLSELPQIEATAEVYAKLIFRLETGRFYSGTDHAFPLFGDDIALVDAHHPLLYLSKGVNSVPVTIRLEAGERVGVITGPNTGGKTAALKSTGLNHVIGKCGFPLFARTARLINCPDVRADIGDRQSLVMDLSTFSSHMLNIRDIVENLHPGSLVLLDEIGTGTEPREGAALAVAVLRHILASGAICLVTTHFAEVKNFALVTKEAAVFSVDYDYETFSPKYRLIKGVAGKSDPLVIARRLGFREDILSDAEGEVSRWRGSIEVAVEEIHRMKAEAERLKLDMEAAKAEFDRKEAELARKETELSDRLQKKELELLEETYALLQKGQRLASERLKSTPDAVKKDLEEVAKKIDSVKSTRKTIVHDIAVGDVVFLDRYQKTGKVLSIDGSRVYLDLEGMKVHISKKDITGKKVEQTAAPAPVKVSQKLSGGARWELVLVGDRVEEALDKLDAFLDASMLAGYDTVYVVHGRGSGQLRKGVHEYLRTDRRAKSYRLGEYKEGGNAVTVVSL